MTEASNEQEPSDDSVGVHSPTSLDEVLDDAAEHLRQLLTELPAEDGDATA
jgi:hypothetical protein